MRIKILGIALATLVLTASAYADAIFTIGNHHVVGELQILFNTGGQTGTTIHGHTNSTPTTIIDFSSTTNTLFSSGGQADIDGVPTGTLIHNITLTVPGFSFTHLIFDPFEPAVANGLTVTALTNTGTSPPFVYGSTHGQNFLTVNAGPGEVLESVTINSSAGFESVGQWRIFGFAPIPEPSSMLLLGSGVLVFVQGLRRKLM